MDTDAESRRISTAGYLSHAAITGLLAAVTGICLFVLAAYLVSGELGKRALDKGDLNSVLAYSRFGFDIDRPSKQHGMTAMCLAARDGNLEALRKLLNSGASANRQSRDGDTPLLLAIKHGRTAPAMELMASGADVSKSDAASLTPLMWCSLTGNMTVMEKALKRGADADAQDRNGNTALMLVVSRDEVRVPDALLLAVPTNGTQSDFERSPAWQEVSALFDRWNGEQAACIRLLRRFGANPKVRNNPGHDAAACYERMSRPEWIRLLRTPVKEGR